MNKVNEKKRLRDSDSNDSGNDNNLHETKAIKSCNENLIVKLPNEILEHLLLLLDDPKYILNFALTSQSYYTIIDNSNYMYNFISKKYGFISESHSTIELLQNVRLTFYYSSKELELFNNIKTSNNQSTTNANLSKTYDELKKLLPIKIYVFDDDYCKPIYTNVDIFDICFSETKIAFLYKSTIGEYIFNYTKLLYRIKTNVFSIYNTKVQSDCINNDFLIKCFFIYIPYGIEIPYIGQRHPKIINYVPLCFTRFFNVAMSDYAKKY
jgi:hypothetical protein